MLAVIACKSVENEVNTTAPAAEDAVCDNPLGFCPDSLECVEGKVKNGQFFSSLLTSLGMSAQEGYNLTQACDGVFDVKNLRVGNSYKAYYDGDGVLKYIVYDASRMSNIIFGIIRAIGIILAGWGLVQVGMSFQSHDPSQRSQGFLCLAGGLIIVFAKSILTAIAPGVFT